MNSGRSLIFRWFWRVLKLAILLAVIGLVIYKLRFAPIPVANLQIEQGDIVAEVMGTGTLEARVRTTISPKISGRIEEILVDEGDRVKKNNVLVKLDNAELLQQVEIAQATLAAAQAAVDRLETDRERAVAVANQAKKEFDRVKKLVGRDAVSESEHDKAVEAAAIADAGIARADAAIVEGKQQVLAAEKTLAYHQTRLADTEIVAPFDGMIVGRQRDPGDVVVPGSPILQLVSLEQLWISAWIDETEMAELAVGQTTRVVFRSEPERAYPGEVSRLAREADRETREFIVDVQVLELPKNWAVGQRAEVYIETARKDNVTLLPADHVQWVDDSAGAFVRQGNRAIWRPLELGLRSREMIEVLNGLQAGDTVVVPSNPRTTLTDGKRITTP